MHLLCNNFEDHRTKNIKSSMWFTLLPACSHEIKRGRVNNDHMSSFKCFSSLKIELKKFPLARISQAISSHRKIIFLALSSELIAAALKCIFELAPRANSFSLEKRRRIRNEKVKSGKIIFVTFEVEAVFPSSLLHIRRWRHLLYEKEEKKILLLFLNLYFLHFLNHYALFCIQLDSFADCRDAPKS